MRLHRFIKDIDLSNKFIRLDDKELLNQIKNVFRLGVGDKIIISDGNVREGVAEIKSFYKNGLELNILDVSNVSTQAKNISLYLAILKKDNFELVVQKATECGIRRIIPLITERTIKLKLNMDRLNKIAIEASEQSERGNVPKIEEPIMFLDAIKHNKYETNLFFDKRGKYIYKIPEYNSVNAGIWIGPEGGWTEEEIKTAEKMGYNIASLGENTFRAETSAILATYLMVNFQS